ncbi:MAG TPA: SCP2 sterol-binding domain-containing protein, partial [Acidimicrobiales bacterium]
LDGPVVDLVLDWHRRNLGYVVGKRAAAPDGASVAFDITGPGGRTERNVLAVQNGRANAIDSDAAADAVLVCDVETYNALLCGRWQARDALANGRLRIEGDMSLGRQVADAMCYVF